MHAPEFWSRRSGVALALAPLGALYGFGARLRQRLARPQACGLPVICVGNLTVGGAGKTPTAIALAEMLAEMGAAPHFLTRGYGGRLAGPVRVDPAVHSHVEVGDEPLLLAEVAPCWVSRDRVAGARAAAAAGAGALVMDDGFQNPHLAKTLSLVVVDGATGFGNGLVMPAGPLRERIGDGLARAGALVVVGSATAAVEATLDRLAAGLPRFGARFALDAAAAALAGRPVVAFAGLARPEKFFAAVGALGCRVVEARAFPDHHVYAPADIGRLQATAQAAGAMLVTTAKDHVRLPPAQRAAVARIDGRMVFDAPQRVRALLARACGRTP
ncbi:MAG: tetraacyldisaccharide 4'-kinase [Alphaproteobacteria bacterium]